MKKNKQENENFTDFEYQIILNDISQMDKQDKLPGKFYDHLWTRRPLHELIDKDDVSEGIDNSIDIGDVVSSFWQSLAHFVEILKSIPIVGGIIMLLAEIKNLVVEFGFKRLAQDKQEHSRKERIFTGILTAVAALAYLSLVFIPGAQAFLTIPFVVISVINMRKLYRNAKGVRAELMALSHECAGLEESLKKQNTEFSAPIQTEQKDNLNHYIRVRARKEQMESSLLSPTQGVLDDMQKVGAAVILIGGVLLVFPVLGQIGSIVMMIGLGAAGLSTALSITKKAINFLRRREYSKVLAERMQEKESESSLSIRSRADESDDGLDKDSTESEYLDDCELSSNESEEAPDHLAIEERQQEEQQAFVKESDEQWLKMITEAVASQSKEFDIAIAPLEHSLKETESYIHSRNDPTVSRESLFQLQQKLISRQHALGQLIQITEDAKIRSLLQADEMQRAPTPALVVSEWKKQMENMFDKHLGLLQSAKDRSEQALHDLKHLPLLTDSTATIIQEERAGGAADVRTNVETTDKGEPEETTLSAQEIKAAAKLEVRGNLSLLSSKPTSEDSEFEEEETNEEHPKE